MPEQPNSPNRGLAPREEKRQRALPRGKTWFLGIGIDKYDDFPPLNNAVKDIRDLIALLVEMYSLEPGNISTLFNEKATRKNIIKTLDHFVDEVKNHDRLIIYYSGHGHLRGNASNGKGFWIPYDAEKDNTAHYIRNSTIREYIEEIEAQHTLLISDACFSGSIFVRGAERSSIGIEELERHRSRWALCSGRHDEKVYDGDPGKNSPFAESILYALRANRLPLFNIAKLVDQVIELTRSNYQQLPEGNPMYGVGHKGGQFVFRLKEEKEQRFEQSREIKTKTPELNLSSGISESENYPAGPPVEAESVLPKIFFMYDEEDKIQVQKLKKFFRMLQRNKKIRLFDMHVDVVYGDERELVIDRNLSSSSIVLCLLTSNFLFTTYDLALKARDMNKIIIPVLLNVVDVSDTFFSRLQLLPDNKRAVKEWGNEDAAFTNIIQGIKSLL